MGVDNRLFHGDNLTMLRRHIADESVDMVYLDPPFNSNANYNVLFKERDGTRPASQIQAFEDSWRWDESAARTFDETVQEGGNVAAALLALKTLVGTSDMLAYLSMMAPRLKELHRVLKPTGSLYLHCDPTASHYLKMLLDMVFGPGMFRSEIIWKRSSAHNDAKQGRRNFGHIHDVLLFYTKSDEYHWETQFTPFDESYVERDYRLTDEAGRRFRRGDLTAAKPGGDTAYEWPVKRRAGVKERWIADLDEEHRSPKRGWEYRSVRPYRGRYWAYSRENMRQFAEEGRLRHTFDGMPEYKRFLDEMAGVPLQDVWTDVPPLIAGTAERLGYATQKPEALLERLIRTSTREGDIVLDPFCGCGTTVAAAQKLKRRWVGIDITFLAIRLIKQRLLDAHQGDATFKLQGAPTSVADARQFAKSDPREFQYWIVDELRARPGARGADRGIDGIVEFSDARGKNLHKVIISVKAGHIAPSHLRDLNGVVTREGAAIGVLVSMETPTRAMRQEAASSGFFQSEWGRHPRLQLITVDELLEGKQIDCPRVTGRDETLKRAPKPRRGVRAVQQDAFAADPLAGTALSRQRRDAQIPAAKTRSKPVLKPARLRPTGSLKKA